MPLPTTITVTGTFLDGDGAPEKGYVEFTSGISAVSSGSNTIVSPVTRRATLDANGSISVGLFATDDPDWQPQGWTWQVTQQTRGGGTRTYSIDLPHDLPDATVDLADLVPVQASSGSAVVASGVLGVNGDSGPYVELDAADVGAATADHTHEASGVTSVNGEVGVVVLTAADLGAATSSHAHSGADITSGLVPFAAMPVGATATTVAQGDHSHDAAYYTQTQVDTALATKVSSSYTGTSDLAAPLINVTFTDVPVSADSDVLSVTQTNAGTAYQTSWLNERGYLRSQQRPGSLFDHLVSLIAHPSGTGNLLNLEVTDGGGSRSNAGGFDSLARNITSLQGWQSLTDFDPGATGHYSIFVAADVDSPGARWDTDDIVRLRGRVNVTTTTGNGEVICSVPADFAPTKRRLLSTSLANGALCPVEVYPDGTIVCRRTSAGTTVLSFDDVDYHI